MQELAVEDLRVRAASLAADCDRLARQLAASQCAQTIRRLEARLAHLQSANEALSREAYERTHGPAESGAVP